MAWCLVECHMICQPAYHIWTLVESFHWRRCIFQAGSICLPFRLKAWFSHIENKLGMYSLHISDQYPALFSKESVFAHYGILLPNLILTICWLVTIQHLCFYHIHLSIPLSGTPRNVAVYNLSNLFKAALLSVDCNFQLVASVVDCSSSTGPVWLGWANYRGV